MSENIRPVWVTKSTPKTDITSSDKVILKTPKREKKENISNHRAGNGNDDTNNEKIRNETR